MTKRLIEVEWDEAFPEGNYEVKLYILAQDRSYLVSDIVTTISQCKAQLTQVNSSVNEDKVTASTFVSVLVKDAEHLNVVLSNLKKIPQVFEVSRTQN